MRERAAIGVLAIAAGVGCGRSHFDARPDAESAVADSSAQASCLTNPMARFVYQTAAFADFTTAWATSGGSWSVLNQQLVQSTGGVLLAFAYHEVAITEYRIVAALHTQANAPLNSAAEIAFRVDAPSSSMYHCNWEPTDGDLILQRTMNGMATTGTQLVTTRVDVTMLQDPSTVTMEVQAVGTTFECCLRGIAGASIVAVDGVLTTGTVGVKTYDMTSGFSDFFVFD